MLGSHRRHTGILYRRRSDPVPPQVRLCALLGAGACQRDCKTNKQNVFADADDVHASQKYIYESDAEAREIGARGWLAVMSGRHVGCRR